MDDLALLVRLEPSRSARAARWKTQHIYVLFDGELSRAAIFALCFVDAAIGSAADEAHNLVAIVDSLLGIVPGEHGLRGIRGI